MKKARRKGKRRASPKVELTHIVGIEVPPPTPAQLAALKKAFAASAVAILRISPRAARSRQAFALKRRGR